MGFSWSLNRLQSGEVVKALRALNRLQSGECSHVRCTAPSAIDGIDDCVANKHLIAQLPEHMVARSMPVGHKFIWAENGAETTYFLFSLDQDCELSGIVHRDDGDSLELSDLSYSCAADDKSKLDYRPTIPPEYYQD